ncbi:hypothetical protein BZK31_02330 [Pseudomonas floridensis]|uniref:Uncharacterized protein n=1 Tax=Pseudomonas floridensis TaxID=1958950 RepID=A0A1X0NCW8_9PSED|nr:hypothetical protein BZK31_02330 [Pseudomonas floridensis]
MSSRYGGNATRRQIFKKLIGLLATIAENDSELQRAIFGPLRRKRIMGVQILKNLAIKPLDKFK